jgi:hypothetical protein
MRRHLRLAVGLALALAVCLPGFAQAGVAQPSAELQWTIDGNPTGPPVPSPQGANDIHFRGAGQAAFDTLQWTKDGEPLGPPIQAPPRANDAHLVWDPTTGTFRGLLWTRNGRVIGRVMAPQGANDAHLELATPGTFRNAVWTQDGQPIGQIQPPQGANDAHVDLSV